MVRGPAAVEANATSTLGSRTRSYPGRYLGAGMQRRGVTASRKPLRSDAILQSVQRSRRSSYHQAGSAPHHAGKDPASVAVPLETVLSQRCEFNMIKGMADADEAEAVDVYCHSNSYKQDPSVEAAPLLLLEMPSIADDAESVCTLACCHTEVLLGAEVPCTADPIGHVMGLPTACVSGTSAWQAKLSETLTVEHTSPTREQLEMIQIDHSSQPPVGASKFSSSASSPLSSSALPTPRKPVREEARGRSKCEIEAVLCLHVVTERLRARHGKVDKSEGADTWAKLAAAGA